MSVSTSTDISRRAVDVWPVGWRVAFRFSFLYWLLYIFPPLVYLLPFGIGDKLNTWGGWPLNRLSHLVGVHLFHLSGEAADWHVTGSGDTAMDYTQVFCIAVIAVVGTIVWSAIAERRDGRREYRTAYAWLRLALRLTLGTTLLSYGFAKIFPSQFGLAPGLWALNATYGDSSPMYLLWFFIGFSRPYAIFGGLVEAVSGVLLLFERTETIGALGAATVLLNIVLMNFCYDVPVKLYSMHLLLMSLFLLLPNFRPMWEFFVRRRTVALAGVWVPRAERRSLRMAGRVALGVVCLLCVWTFVVVGYRSRTMPTAHSPLYGVWSVDSVTGWPDAHVPQKITLEDTQVARVRAVDGNMSRYPVEYNASQQSIRFVKMDKGTLLHWDGPADGKAELRGDWMGVPVTLNMHRIDPQTYLLTSRGFHWVQEDPYNRAQAYTSDPK